MRARQYKNRTPLSTVRRLVWVWNFVVLTLSISVHAQGGAGNPFELAALDHQERSASNQQEFAAPPSGNPFDIISTARNKPEMGAGFSSNPFDLIAGVEREDGTGPLPPDSLRPVHLPPSLSLIFWVMTGLLVLITLALTGPKQTLAKCGRALTNDNWLRVLLREHKRRTNFSLYWLTALGFLSIGFFAFLTLSHFGYPAHYTFENYLLLSGILLFLHILRQIVLMIIGAVFRLGDMMARYRLGLSIFAMLPGLALFPFGIALAFAPDPIGTPIAYSGLGLFALLNLYYLLGAIDANRKRILKNKFRFFLYLCIVEIAPVLLILKLLLDFSANV